jgi:hypothetical protein
MGVLSLSQMIRVYTNTPIEDAADIRLIYGLPMDAETGEHKLTYLLESKQRICDSWPKIAAGIKFQGDKKKTLQKYNIYSEYGLWVFDDVSKACLEDFVRPYAEFLPLQCEKQALYLLNVFHVVDAVDLDRCEIACPEQIDWNDPDPAIMEYVFFESVVERAPLFRVPYRNITKAFFTSRFIDEVEKHGLTGFGYRRLWSSE